MGIAGWYEQWVIHNQIIIVPVQLEFIDCSFRMRQAPRINHMKLTQSVTLLSK